MLNCRIRKGNFVPQDQSSEPSPLPPSFDYTDSYAFMERVRTGMPPLIIYVACNGGIQGKEANEAIPETADEIAESVGSAYEAGAAMVHIHARDPQDLTRCAGVLNPGGKFCANTCAVPRRHHQRNHRRRSQHDHGGARLLAEAGREVASLNLAPDMSRFRLKERLPPLPNPHPALDIDECVAFTYGQIHQFAAMMQLREIKPELECTIRGVPGWCNT